MSTIKDARDYVLAQAKANIAFVKQSKANVEQAHQVNISLANIVAMERNMVMHDALQRSRLINPNDVPGLR
jgi:uncharacterized protein YrrD